LIVEGVYTYRIDDQGQIVALRAYWEPDHLRLESPDVSIYQILDTPDRF
jgi:hypothetical protein